MKNAMLITLLLIATPLFLLAYLALCLLWYPTAALLRLAQLDVPYPHEHMAAFMKGELVHAH